MADVSLAQSKHTLRTLHHCRDSEIWLPGHTSLATGPCEVQVFGVRSAYQTVLKYGPADKCSIGNCDAVWKQPSP